MKLTFQVMYLQFWLFLHVNYSSLRNIIKLLSSIAADSIVDAISFITGVLFCDQKTSISQIRLRLRPNLSSEIRPNSASAKFEKVKFGATLVSEKWNLQHSDWCSKSVVDDNVYSAAWKLHPLTAHNIYTSAAEITTTTIINLRA